jgi:hypothetical protein
MDGMNEFQKMVNDRLSSPFDPIAHEFEMLRNLYYGLKPLEPNARQRVVSHVMGMLKADTPIPNGDR